MTTILITDCDMGAADLERAVLEAAEYRVLHATCATEDEVIAAVHDSGAVGLLVQYAPITRRVLGEIGSVRALVRYGVGMDNVDVAACEDLGVTALNVADYGSAEVADHAMSLMLSLLRGVPAWSTATAQGSWPVRGELPDPRELRECTLGLLGFGAIARNVCARARAFGMRVVAHDPFLDDSRIEEHGAEPVTFEALFPVSDILSVHVPLTDATRGVVNLAALDAMPAASYVVNTARAGLVDRDSLVAALDSGRLAGAGLDVWWQEPAEADDPLAADPRVLLTPHVAWLSTGSVGRLRTSAAERLRDALTKSPHSPSPTEQDSP